MTPFRHAYHQSFVCKASVGRKPDQVPLPLDALLDLLREVNRLTGGLKQIVYLSGWQYDGHDSGYPAWGEVNPRLRLPGDEDARASLEGVMRDARAFNAVVSLHVNMTDAYMHSPLWAEYAGRDLLIREAGGGLKKGGFWNGDQAYLVCKKREWESGLARRRIDALLDLLPLGEAGTVHIDAFEPLADPFHDITDEADADAMAESLAYWISRGVDVTTEWLHERFVGLTPMVWHLNSGEAARLRYPAQVVCGGGDEWNFRRRKWTLDLFGANWIRQPEAGCLYERAWGTNQSRQYGRPGIPANFTDRFCLRTLPWYNLCRRAIQRHVHTAGQYEVQFAGGMRSVVVGDDESYRLEENGRALIVDEDLCMPAAWREATLLAYSRAGGRRRWTLPPDWPAGRGLARRPWGADRADGVVPVGQDGAFDLDLAAGQALWLTPAAG